MSIQTKGEVGSAAVGYLPGIDGLRAIAVSAVMLFHLDPTYLPGGFTGVDVFFVISGFVVTGSLLNRNFQDLRSLLVYFYARRLVRIMPALVVMLLFTGLLTQLFIPDGWLSKGLRTSGLAAFVGASNIALAFGEDGYFAPRSGFNPYTHTWSLGVEEQFYFIFPFLLYLGQRTRSSSGSSRLAIGIITSVTTASLVTCYFMANINHGWAFYLIPARFWELGSGMLLCMTLPRWRAMLVNQYISALVTACGVILVAVGFYIPEEPNFPFPLGIIPVAGTAALIAATCTPQATMFKHILGSAPLLYIGRRSYSLYLWHWPIYVIMRWTIGLSTYEEHCSAIVLTTVFALGSYRWIERPTREAQYVKSLPSYRIVAISLFGIGAATSSAWLLDRVGNRIKLTATANRADWYADGSHPIPVGVDRCGIKVNRGTFAGGAVVTYRPAHCRSSTRVVAIGDSHNLAYVPLYRNLVASTGMEVTYYFKSGCGYLYLNKPQKAPNCAHYYIALNSVILGSHPSDIIFLPSLRLNWLIRPFGPADTSKVASAHDKAAGMQAARAILNITAKTGAAVLFEAPKPLLPAPPFRCADWFNRANDICKGGLSIERGRIEAMRAWHMAAMRSLSEQYPRVGIWDPLPTLCPETKCRAFRNGRPLFFDGDHVSGYAGDLLLDSFSERVATAAKMPPAT